MAEDISISLSNIQSIKTVNIEGVGVFKVRRLGAGEELDLSIKMRRLMAIARDMDKLNLKDIDTTTQEGMDKFNLYSADIDKYSEEISEIKNFELETYKKCFTDDSDGHKVDFLIKSLSDSERAELFKQIFGDVKIVEKESVN